MTSKEAFFEGFCKAAGRGGQIINSASPIKLPKVPGRASDRVATQRTKRKPNQGRVIGSKSKSIHPDVNPRGAFADIAARQRARKRQLLGGH